MKTAVVVSRKWNHPQIEAFVSSKDVGARMELEAFLDALVEEVGNPTMLLTKQQLRSRLEAAKDHVLKEMKETTKVVV